MRYALTTLANLLVLVTGIGIGVYVAPHLEKHVQASGGEGGVAMDGVDPKVTSVQPSMTTGTVGIYLVLSHHIQADELVVNGYDMMQLHNVELELLSRFVPQQEIKNAIETARSKEMFTVAQPQPPKPAAVPPPTK